MSVKEALSEETLQREMLEDDKASLALALTKVHCFPGAPATLKLEVYMPLIVMGNLTDGD